MPFDRVLEAIRNVHRFDASRQIRNQEAEFVAAEPCVQVPRIPAPLEREIVLRPNLIRQDPGDAFDDLVADRMTERVVVRLEAVDVDDADAAPADALLDGEERFDPLHEPVEIEQLRFRVAVGFFGQPGDDFFEVTCDVADGDVLFGQLPLEPRHLFGEPFGHRADGFVLRLLDQLTLARDHRFDGTEELSFLLFVERQPLPHPCPQVRRTPGRGCRRGRFTVVGWEKLGHSH